MFSKNRRIISTVVLCAGVWFVAASACRAMDHGRKVFLLGLDGAAWRVLLPLMEQGELPYLTALIQSGMYGSLHSEAAFSPVSWNSIVCGVDQATHGIDGFYTDIGVRCRFKSPSVRPDQAHVIISSDRTAVPVWRFLNDAGKRTGVIGFLNTYPVETIDGIMISGDLAPNLLSKKTITSKFEREAVVTGRGRFKGTLLGSEAVIEEGADGALRLRFPADRKTEFGILPLREPGWIRVRLDEALDILGTDVDIVPTISRAEWVRTDGPPALQVVLPSGTIPSKARARKCRPLLMVLTASRPAGAYDTVRFTYTARDNNLEQSMEVYGVPIRGRLEKPISHLAQGGTVLLHPIRDSASVLRITWPAGSVPGATVNVQDREPTAATEAYLDWAAGNRRKALNIDSAFRAIAKVTTYPTGTGLALALSVLYDDFTQPFNDFIYPHDLLANLDPGDLPVDLDLQIYRNHRIKKYFFDHVFDPDRFDCFMLCFTATDKVQHFPWNSPDPRDNDMGNHHRVIVDRWKEIDGYVRDITSRLGSEWSVVIASDHGFIPVYTRQRIVLDWNRILLDLGLLFLEPEQPSAGNEPGTMVQAWRIETTCRCDGKINWNECGRLRLVSSTGETAADWKWYPGNGAYPTSLWQPGTLVTGCCEPAFSGSIPPGTYHFQLTTSLASDQSAEMVDLGPIEIHPGAGSLINPLMFRRIGDVRVKSATVTESPQSGPPNAEGGSVRLVEWRVEPIAYRGRGFLESATAHIDRSRSRVVFLDDHDLEGDSINQERMVLLGGARADDGELLAALAAMVESATIDGKRPLVRRASIDRRKRSIGWNTDQAVFGDFRTTNGIRHRCYDAAADLHYKVGTRMYQKPLAEVVRNACIGSHESNGVYAVSGPGVPRTGLGPDACERDIAATVLALMEVEIPAGMDSRPIRYDEASATPLRRNRGEINDEELYERLKSIGYLDTM
ncbi:alkaline phosphatase family protein [bacterium]|nr:alkaline phosphatase family protein [candidate division CSSED10-310 bacterium]